MYLLLYQSIQGKRYPQISGFSFTYDDTLNSGSRVTSMTDSSGNAILKTGNSNPDPNPNTNFDLVSYSTLEVKPLSNPSSKPKTIVISHFNLSSK
jgi:hypothetical protein